MNFVQSPHNKYLKESKEKVDRVIELIQKKDILREIYLRLNDPDLCYISFDIIRFMIKSNQLPEYFTDIFQSSYTSNLKFNVIEKTWIIKNY
jgi:hypothetical protein